MDEDAVGIYWKEDSIKPIEVYSYSWQEVPQISAIYLLEGSDGTLYVGQSKRLRLRLEEHLSRCNTSVVADMGVINPLVIERINYWEVPQDKLDDAENEAKRKFLKNESMESKLGIDWENPTGIIEMYENEEQRINRESVDRQLEQEIDFIKFRLAMLLLNVGSQRKKERHLEVIKRRLETILARLEQINIKPTVLKPKSR